jgi:hypothetical protein
MKLYYNSLSGMHWVWVVRGRVRKRLSHASGHAAGLPVHDAGGLRAAREINGQHDNRTGMKN